MEKISAVYKIVNTVTGDSYVGSSRNVFRRWLEHKRPYNWKRYSNMSLYQDFQKYGLDKFRFQILAPVMPEYLKQVEQEFIDLLHPTYNSIYAKGRNIERMKESWRKAWLKYQQSDKFKEAKRKHEQQLCSYMGETLTLNALSLRFLRAGIEHYTQEAKKYLIGDDK